MYSNVPNIATSKFNAGEDRKSLIFLLYFVSYLEEFQTVNALYLGEQKCYWQRILEIKAVNISHYIIVCLLSFKCSMFIETNDCVHTSQLL